MIPIRNARFNQFGGIDCEVYVSSEWLPFTASEDDSNAFGREVYAAAASNDQTIPARIVPTLTVTAFNIEDGDGTTRRPAIKIVAPADEAISSDLIKYEIRLAGDTVNIITSGTLGVPEGQTVTTDGLVSDTIYEVRAQYVTENPADWTAWIAVTTGDVRLTAQDIVDAYNFRVDQAFERHDQALETLTSGSVFQLLNDTQITDAILAAQNSTSDAQQVVAFEEVGDASAAIVTEQIARADGDTAVASTVTALTARVGDNEGSITTINATKVNAAGAVSAVETAISATYGSITALASATSFAEATVNGIEAGYVWELNGSNILEIVSVQDGVGSTPISTARISADYVQITGLTQIDQAVINTLAADTGFISNLEVDTLNIAGNAVTIPVTGTSSQLTGNGSLQAMVNVSFILPAVSNVLILWTIEQGYIGTTPTWGYQLRKSDGTFTYDERSAMTFGNDFPTGQLLLTNQPAGAFNVQLRWNGQNSNITGQGSMTVLAVMR